MRRVFLILICLFSFCLPSTVRSANPDLPYKTYLPLAMQSSGETPPLPEPLILQQKGLAMAHAEFAEDRQSLNVSWWYNYTPRTDAGQVPMSRDGSMISLPETYSGYLLLFNEPNNVEPYGAPLDAQTAVDRYQAMITAYPNAKIVVGNVSAWDSVYYGSWLKNFIAECNRRAIPLPTRWGLHGYIEAWITPSYLEKWWAAQHELTGGNIWITEYGVTSGDLVAFQNLTNWINQQPWIERYAAFTNRQKGDEAWFVPGWEGVSLLTWDGSLTEIGRWFAGR